LSRWLSIFAWVNFVSAFLSPRSATIFF
jgi:hypothetical protein